MALRLKEIKMAGFKSFVDPTRVMLSSNLSAIVGPNGCGKSNVIDAIRLVMGESSASKLRGGQISDMIFSGSASRKPVGQASVELIFDNSDGTIGGEFANFGEIGIRRLINRDGNSKFYLNNTPCRRKDITDIFLGTGIGPRSYSIIEQGMVSRIIEAKPEDMRLFIEEAAKISTCRERRRETEIRIRHTRDNLDRLNDLRDEVNRQLVKLEKQSDAAEKYQQCQKERAQLEAELVALRWKEQEDLVVSYAATLLECETQSEKHKSEWQHLCTQAEKRKQELHALTQTRDDAQRAFYQITSEANQVEQELSHRKKRAVELEQDSSQSKGSLDELSTQLAADLSKEQEIEDQLSSLSPRLHSANEVSAAAVNAAQAAEGEMVQWQQSYDKLSQEASVPTRRADVLKTSLAHLEEKVRFNYERQQQLKAELNKLDIEALDGQKTSLVQSMSEQNASCEQIAARVVSLSQELKEQRAHIQAIEQERDQLGSDYQICTGRLSSLEALQQAALGKEDNNLTEWLQGHDLANAPQLAERLQVNAQWQIAVETVLGDAVQAVCLDALPSAQQWPGGATFLRVSGQPSTVASSAKGSLLINELKNRESVGSLLDNIYCAATLQEALGAQSGLQSHESFVTPEGFWVGPDWVRIPAESGSDGGVLARQGAIEALQAQRTHLGEQKQALADTLAQSKQMASVSESQLSDLSGQRHEADKQLGEIKSQLASVQSKLDQQQKRQQQIQDEAAVISRNIQDAESKMEAMRAELEEVLEKMSNFSESKVRLEAQKEAKAAKVQETRLAMKQAVDEAHAIELQWQSLTNECQSLRKAISRAQQQQGMLSDRLAQLQLSVDENASPIENLTQRLQECLDTKLNAESRLTQARDSLGQAEQALDENEKAANVLNKSISALAEKIQSIRMEQQSSVVRREGFESQLATMGQSPNETMAQMDPNSNASEWQARIEKLANRMTRLEPINLAAIDEYAQQSERKGYLDAQHDDLMEAVTVLEDAIEKIDTETRARFKETFEEVNNNFQTLFPRLFGGGRAMLKLTEDDILDSGVSVMAQPPGKRNSMIQQLSGGEKALVAVALVFAIFQLNPAPFCLLDEVDAPLDDANVGRFTEMVREMSDKTQFIFITHNKVTMALADVLMGVTMREPGVSRVVSVNVEEAAELAEA